MIQHVELASSPSVAAGLSGSAARVLLVLQSVAGPDGSVEASLRSIAASAGASRSTASEAMRELLEAAVLERTSVGGGRSVSRYRLNPGFRLSGQGARPGGREAPGAAGAWRPLKRAPARAFGSAQQQFSSSSSDAGHAAASGGAAERPDFESRKRQALQLQGVDDPVLSQLARDPYLKPTVVTEQIAKAIAHDKGTGALIQNLRAIARGERERAAQARARAPAVEQPDSALSGESDHRTRELELADSDLRYLPPHELTRLAEAAFARLPPVHQRRVEREHWRERPLDCKPLRFEMCKRLLEAHGPAAARCGQAGSG